mmetsp:Transcript_18455/g.21193  ORF Transcript_18455/g.21193 Transcript_18455/m.21193 type:complete len:118 (-) Transcript_18455:821-1174(-)|eukprot:CAMPEP_0168326300 /NCGR_PEP_ID=MMETSP0213-20121227/5216_1 /TAXON_ID=151035 /ORGANISM="Euplotes harpa, Strain FSP1.4" /LENGTH=117 /DNA_ID=CAMNT_0008328979 /DNA_START=644 /DNA_END=997 /DNA_ORIENTATION=-
MDNDDDQFFNEDKEFVNRLKSSFPFNSLSSLSVKKRSQALNSTSTTGLLDLRQRSIEKHKTPGKDKVGLKSKAYFTIRKEMRIPPAECDQRNFEGNVMEGISERRRHNGSVGDVRDE